MEAKRQAQKYLPEAGQFSITRPSGSAV